MWIFGALFTLACSLLVGCAAGPGEDELRVMNDSKGSVAVDLWSGDGLPKDPTQGMREEAAERQTLPPGGTWKVTLAKRTPEGPVGAASSVVAMLAVRGEAEPTTAAQWIALEGTRPPGGWAVRVFGESPNLKVARVSSAQESDRMERTLGPRPPSIGTMGGASPGPQR